MERSRERRGAGRGKNPQREKGWRNPMELGVAPPPKGPPPREEGGERGGKRREEKEEKPV